MHNVEIAWAFKELADLLEFKGDNYFKIRAYRQAARIIENLVDPVEDMYHQRTLDSIRGIGKNIASKVGELAETGQMEKLEKLRLEISPGLTEIMLLPGIGPKRAGFLYENLGVKNLAELEQAARDGKIRQMKGMGHKTEIEIIRNAELIRNRSGRFPLGLVKGLAYSLSAYMDGVPGVEKVSVAGSVRRWKETVEDIDLLAASRDFEIALDAMARHPRTREVVTRMDDYIRIITWWGIPVELVVVHPEDFWFFLLLKTGSKKHLEELAGYAAENNLDLTATGIKQHCKDIMYRGLESEEDIYSVLNLDYIPPELRQGTCEIELARVGKLPTLLTTGDIAGDLHVHSQYSDGLASIEDIVNKALEKGYEYVAITDHSQSLRVAGGLSPERLADQFAYIENLNKCLDGITVLKGVEVDILAKGGLDLDDQLLESADVVVASIHSGFKQSPEIITSRIIEAVENKHVDIIGHLTGRLLGSRQPYSLDVEKILERAAKNKKIMEINASPDRLDLNETHARMAVDFGARIAINTDAHDLKQMDDMEHGVAVARRAGLNPTDVVNTLKYDDFIKVIKV